MTLSDTPMRPLGSTTRNESLLKSSLLVPPAELDLMEGVLALGSVAVCGTLGNRLQVACERFASLLDGSKSGSTLRVRVESKDEAYPCCGMDESYQLRVSREGIDISAPQQWGAIRAFSLLAELLDERSQLPCLEVRDAPSYNWRGLMLDPARRFLSIEALKRTLLGMWACRLNILHLHLSDDQGLRVPLLGRTPPEAHYCVQDMQALVDCAADFGIRVVPEIDIPGHATALLTSFPHWARDVPPEQASKRFGVHANFVDCANRDVLAELDEMLGELAGLFPDQYVHLGGDECVGYEKPAGLSALLADMASRHGKRLILWDEALEEELPHGVCVQAWRHHSLLETARSHGHDTILSAPYYLDLMYSPELHHQFDPGARHEDRRAAQENLIAHPWLGDARGPLSWYEAQTGGLAESLEAELSPAASEGGLLGGEACLWGELVGEAQLDTRLWSRMPAIANRFWLGKTSFLPDPDQARRHLRRVSGIHVGPEPWLKRLGLTEVETSHAACLMNSLEPIKWYTRLLGGALAERMEEVQAQAQRPYDVDSTLNRVVDFVDPESIEAWRFKHADNKVDFANAWRDQRACIADLAARFRQFDEVLPLSERLADLAEVLKGLMSLEAFLSKHPDADQPVSELTLAVLVPVIDWTSARSK